MNEHVSVLIRGIGVALCFIGLFGFAINDRQWGVSFWLIAIGTLTLLVPSVIKDTE